MKAKLEKLKEQYAGELDLSVAEQRQLGYDPLDKLEKTLSCLRYLIQTPKPEAKAKKKDETKK